MNLPFFGGSKADPTAEKRRGEGKEGEKGGSGSQGTRSLVPGQVGLSLFGNGGGGNGKAGAERSIGRGQTGGREGPGQGGKVGSGRAEPTSAGASFDKLTAMRRPSAGSVGKVTSKGWFPLSVLLFMRL